MEAGLDRRRDSDAPRLHLESAWVGPRALTPDLPPEQGGAAQGAELMQTTLVASPRNQI